MLATYEDFINRLFYPNITLGTIAYVGIPTLIGGLVGGKRGAVIGAGLALARINYKTQQTQQELDARP